MYYNLIKWFLFTLQSNVILKFQMNSLVLKSVHFFAFLQQSFSMFGLFLCDSKTMSDCEELSTQMTQKTMPCLHVKSLCIFFISDYM